VPIVDRVGGGDSFCGGLIYGLRTYDDVQQALNVSSQYPGKNGKCRSDLLSDQAAVSKTALRLP
jgi:sugar/nucleoside kinase (ribokinase family)